METKTLHHNNEHHDDGQPNSKVILGFWLYLMTDALMFAVAFAVYSVLRNQIFGSLNIHDITKLPCVLTQTLLFIASSFAMCMAAVSVQAGNKKLVNIWLVITFVLGAIFTAITLQDLALIVKSGHSWEDSAFLSAYFTLIGMHLVHVLIGLLWIIVLMVQFCLIGFNNTMAQTRMVCLSLYWNYLNVIWVIIFSIVYLMGAI